MNVEVSLPKAMKVEVSLPYAMNVDVSLPNAMNPSAPSGRKPSIPVSESQMASPPGRISVQTPGFSEVNVRTLSVKNLIPLSNVIR